MKEMERNNDSNNCILNHDLTVRFQCDRPVHASAISAPWTDCTVRSSYLFPKCLLVLVPSGLKNTETPLLCSRLRQGQNIEKEGIET